MKSFKEYTSVVYEAFKGTPSPEEMRARVASANINQQSLLATDYLNHFNEVAMIMEMLPDMPDFVEDVKSWEHKSYKQHFQESTFTDKDLAVAAYDCVPTPYLVAFEGAAGRAAKLVVSSVSELEAAIQTGERERIELVTKEVCAGIEDLMSNMRSIINGELGTLAQDDIDAMLLEAGPSDAVDSAAETSDASDGGLDQGAIDSLFD